MVRASWPPIGPGAPPAAASGNSGAAIPDTDGQQLRRAARNARFAGFERHNFALGALSD
jgi:hypothetical protein